MRTIILSLLAIMMAAAARAEGASPVVVELYTSQGCSSCPPADAYMGELARRDDVIGLSFHVDYWDYIGWKDTFALPEAAERQRRYAERMNLRYVYTPQMVIGGRRQEVGSNRNAIETAIDYVRMMAPPVHIAFERNNDGSTGRLRLQGPPPAKPATVWLAEIDYRRRVRITRGENRSRELNYFNVVRRIRPLGTWEGGEARYDLDLAAIAAAGRDGCVVIVQEDGSAGPLLGALRIDVSG